MWYTTLPSTERRKQKFEKWSPPLAAAAIADGDAEHSDSPFASAFSVPTAILQEFHISDDLPDNPRNLSVLLSEVYKATFKNCTYILRHTVMEDPLHSNAFDSIEAETRAKYTQHFVNFINFTLTTRKNKLYEGIEWETTNDTENNIFNIVMFVIKEKQPILAPIDHDSILPYPRTQMSNSRPVIKWLG